MRVGERVSICVIVIAFISASCDAQETARAVPDPTLSPCVPPGVAVNMPNRLIEVFPLPHGTRVTTAKLVGVGPLVVAGYVPGDLPEAAAFFQRELVRSGFNLSDGYAGPTKTGATMDGHGLEGSWQVSSLDDCPGSVVLTVSVSER